MLADKSVVDDDVTEFRASENVTVSDEPNARSHDTRVGDNKLRHRIVFISAEISVSQRDVEIDGELVLARSDGLGDYIATLGAAAQRRRPGEPQWNSCLVKR